MGAGAGRRAALARGGAWSGVAAAAGWLGAPARPVVASEPRRRDPAEAAVRMAQLETDPEAALEAWDIAVEVDGGTARALAQPPRRTGDPRADAAIRALLFDSRGLARL